MYATSQERWLFRVLSNSRFSLNRVKTVSGGRVENTVLQVSYGDNASIVCSADLQVGVLGQPQNLVVFGSSALQTVSCTNLTINGQSPLFSLGNAVLYEAQSGITAAMQTAARTNIAAVSSTDSRLSDARLPLGNSITDTHVAGNAGIAMSKIGGLTDALAGKLPLSGGTLTGNLTVSKALTTEEIEVWMSIYTPTANKYASLYLNSPFGTGQIYTGDANGRVFRTNSPMGMTFTTNHTNTALTISSTGLCNFPQTPTANGTPLVKTDDTRLSDTRTPTDDSVNTTKIQDARA
jgi:hypothetical protein